MSCVLLGVLALAAVALLFCVLVNYLCAWWDDAGRDPATPRAGLRDSLFTSDWFFLLNALLCFASLLGLIFCL